VTSARLRLDHILSYYVTRPLKKLDKTAVLQVYYTPKASLIYEEN